MEITEIKSHLNILTVLGHYNLKPNKHGMLSCPFHENDKTPSLKIYPKTNTFFCFSCGISGDTIEFIEKYEKITKHQAILKSKTMLNIHEIPPKAGINPTYEIPTKEPEEKQTLPRIAVLSKIALDTKASFKRTAVAQDYLKTRGLEADKLEVGYIGEKFGKGWNAPLQENALKFGILKKSRQDTFVPKFRNCVLFFTKNEKGQIIDLYGRSISLNGDAKHFYLNGQHQGIYPEYPKPETKKLILTESIIDCETLLQQKEIAENFTVIALFGTNGFTQEIEEAIKNLPGLNEIILFFDGDEAGKNASIKLNEKLLQILPSVKITKVDTPEGEDINSLLQGHDPEILAHLIQQRQTINSKNGDFFILSENENEPETQPILNTDRPERITYEENSLKFTIWGGIEKENIHRLKINLLVQLVNDDFKYFQDDVNLYSNSQLQRYIKGAAEELECSTTVLKTTIKKLQNHLEEYRLKLLEEEKRALKPRTYQMERQEEKQAMNFLKSKNLVQNTIDLIQKSGLVGEQKNGLLLFFLYLSRLMDEPLHAIIFGKSGSGKTYLQTKISECLPEESVRTITSLTENTLYYSAKDFWKHKVLLIEDLEGIYHAFLPLREFMSRQSITKLTTDKDAKGNNVQKVLFVEGPVCVSGATTRENIYEDNANRSFLLHVDESNNHLNQVMDYQRKLQAGLINEQEQQESRKLLKNAQRLLRKIKVINPYAPKLVIPDCVFKKLRTNMHYLKLIEIITLYHQHQREWKTGKDGKPYIETTLEDIKWANFLVKETLLRKSDELNGDVRKFFEILKNYQKSQNGQQEENSFYAKEIREAFRMNPMKTNRYLRELENRSYIQRTGGNRKAGYEYEIKAWDEYEKLKSGIDILDDILQKLKCNISITEV